MASKFLTNSELHILSTTKMRWCFKKYNAPLVFFWLTLITSRHKKLQPELGFQNTLLRIKPLFINGLIPIAN